jgi:hypothetical protein
MKLLSINNMSQLIKFFLVSGKEENRGFQLLPAIVMLLLAISFQGAIIYVMVSSFFQP